MAKLNKEHIEYFKNPEFLFQYLQALNGRLVYSNNIIENDNGPISNLYDNAHILTLNDNFRAFNILLNKLSDIDEMPLTEELIITVANTINEHSKYISNGYRKIKTDVKLDDIYPIESSSNIHKFMKKLLDNYYGDWSNLDIYEREALFNIEFLRIHPFEDGNGRTSRLILNFNMLSQGHAPILIPENKRDEYIKARDEENVGWIKNFFEEESEKELQAINDLIKDYKNSKNDNFNHIK